MSKNKRGLVVPLKFDDVVVGKVSCTDDGTFHTEVTNASTVSYLKELFLVGEVVGINVSLDTLSEKMNCESSLGHLHIVRGDNDHQEAEEASSSREARSVRG